MTIQLDLHEKWGITIYTWPNHMGISPEIHKNSAYVQGKRSLLLSESSMYDMRSQPYALGDDDDDDDDDADVR